MNPETKMTYQIIEAPDARTLEENVTILLEYGWELQGGLCVNRDAGNRTVYSQALTQTLKPE